MKVRGGSSAVGQERSVCLADGVVGGALFAFVMIAVVVIDISRRIIGVGLIYEPGQALILSTKVNFREIDAE